MYLSLNNLNRYLNPDFRVGYHSFEPFPVSLRSFFDHEFDTYARRFKATEENGSLVLSLDLPGFKPADVDIQLERGVLTVHARSATKNAKDEIEQSVTVGDDIDPDKVEAKLEDGVLTLTLGRHEATKPRKIAIK